MSNQRVCTTRIFFGIALPFILGIFVFFIAIPPAFTQQSTIPIEVNGDQVEYLMDGNRLVAKGHVSVVQGQTQLTADKIEFSRDTKIAIGEGNIVLKSPQGTISADSLIYNFGTMTGEFTHAGIIAAIENEMAETEVGNSTFYGYADTAAKVSENQITLKQGYITTCDLKHPHFQLFSKIMDIFPKDKMIARNVKMVVGNAPIFYIPKYTQALDGKQKMILTPGYKKDWGMFLLTQWRYQFNENFKGTLYVDFREKRDKAIGADLKYKIKNGGEGIIRAYYMNERPTSVKHFWQERTSPTPEHERFRSEWRHKWAIDDQTDLTLQYSKISDDAFLKDYFKREYQKDSNPQSFFLVTRNLTNGIVSFRADARVNRFESAVERLPDIRYDVTNQKIGDSNFYFKSENGFVNLNKKEASPTEVRKETMRMDSNNELSYPLKAFIFEVRPFVGGRQTYYSRTKDPSRYDVIRGIFRTGADLSTKFYKTLDTKTNFFGIEINKLRHVITPSAIYEYIHRPTLVTSLLDSFDSIDGIDRRHNISFSLENKLQTKRDGVSIDLLRVVASTDFHLKENPTKGGFDSVRTDIEFKPTSRLNFTVDSHYDTYDDKLSSVNFEFHLKDKEEANRWTFDFGKRYAPAVDDQITAEWNYRINPKWKFKAYRRMDILHNLTKEQEYTVTRDLHCWEMDINFNETQGSGSEIWIVFRLKAFPEMGFDFGTGFNKRKTGSQSSIGAY